MPEKNDLEKLVIMISSNNFFLNRSNPISNSSYSVECSKSIGATSSSTIVSESNVVSKKNILKQKWKTKHQLEINASERERKGRLAASIKKLKEMLPIKSVKLQTKESILEEALKYIKKLKEQVEEMLLKDAPENLVLEIKKLRKRVEDMEKERKFFERVLQSHGLLSENQVKTAKIPVSREPAKLKEKVTITSTTTRNDSTFGHPTSTSNFSLSSASSHSNPTTATASTASLSIPTQVSPCIAFHQSCLDLPPPCSGAFCTPTYTVARMKHSVRDRLPSTVPSDRVQSADLTSTGNSSSTSFSTASVTISTPVASSSTCSLPASTADQSSADTSSAQQILSSNSMSTQLPADHSSSLKSWLRNGDNSSQEELATSHTPPNQDVFRGSSNPNTMSIPSLNHPSVTTLNQPSVTSPPYTNRKDTNSFNIASLMESKNAASNHQSSTAAVNQLPTTLLASTSGNSDCSASSPKDTFHQALDAEIFDCLQFVDASYKHSTTSTSIGATSSSDFPYGYDTTTPRKLNYATTPHKSAFPSFDLDLTRPDAIRVPSCSGPCEGGWAYLDFSSDTRLISTHAPHAHPNEIHQGLQSRQRTSVVGKLPLPRRPHVTSTYDGLVPNSVAVSLWQPAVVNSNGNHPVASGSPQVQDCFPPKSHSYLSGHRHRRISSVTHQNLNSSWLSPHPQNDDISFGLAAMLSVAPDAENLKSKGDSSKKRKLPRTDHKSTSKKKKTVANHHQGDSHSISRLIGGVQPSAPTVLPRAQSFSNSPIVTYISELVPTPNPNPLYHPSGSNSIPPSHLNYNSYGPQSNLFHSPQVTPQAPYAPHANYFYNPSAARHGEAYVPRYANVNNNNNKTRGSQHHISRILS